VPDTVRPDVESAFVAPRTRMESIIAEIWKELLLVDRVSVLDNFFDLGGHSLLSIRVVAKLEKAVGFRLNPRELIYQTLEQIASFCEKKLSTSGQLKESQTEVYEESNEIFYFGPTEKRLFGCYHPPQNGIVRDCGIVLCYPMGQEYIRSHRSFLQLAALLSRKGFPVLRFDYYGTGDSMGDCEDGNIQQWIFDVSTAIDEIRKRSRFSRTCLVGLRIGGTLSALASVQRSDVDSIVLWNPVVQGAAYVKELKTLQKSMLKHSYVNSRTEQKNKSFTEILGFRIHNDILSDLQNINLLKMNQRPARNIFIIENSEDHAIKQLKDQFLSSSEHLKYKCLPDPKIWLQEPNRGLIPNGTLQSVISWISEANL
jgi:esterase/lipase/acyl carrier protein